MFIFRYKYIAFYATLVICAVAIGVYLMCLRIFVVFGAMYRRHGQFCPYCLNMQRYVCYARYRVVVCIVGRGAILVYVLYMGRLSVFCFVSLSTYLTSMLSLTLDTLIM